MLSAIHLYVVIRTELGVEQVFNVCPVEVWAKPDAIAKVIVKMINAILLLVTKNDDLSYVCLFVIFYFLPIRFLNICE